MRSQQLAVLDMGALRGVGFARGGIADVECSVAPHGVHDHRQLARYRDASLGVTGAFLDLPATALDPVPALEARHQTGRRFVERAPHVRVVSLRDAAPDVDRSARLPALRGQPEVGRDVMRTACSKAPRPILLKRMPNDFSEWRMAFSRSTNLVFKLRRCVSRRRVR